jgi:hypothetical protein
MVKLFWYALLLLMFTTSTTHALRQDQLAALRNAEVVLQAPAMLHVPKDGTGEGEITYTVTGFEGSWPHRLKVNMKTLYLSCAIAQCLLVLLIDAIHIHLQC